MKNHLIFTVGLLLKKNNIFFNKNELALQIQSHPSYPSLHAITGVLDHFNIDNVAAIVPITVNTVTQLPNYFIAQIKIESEKDLIFIEKNKLEYIVYYSKTKKKTLHEKEFLKVFTGVILAIEKTKESSLNTKKSSKLKKTVPYLAFILSCIYFLSFKPTLSTSFYIILSVLGAMVSLAILRQELGLNSTIGDAFCSSSNDKKDCDAVLSSNGSMLFKKFKLSDVSFVYFLWLVFSTFLISIQNSNLDILYYTSFLGIPVIIFSLYYQYNVVKKWCFLCLTIALILSFQASFVFFLDELSVLYSVNNFLTLAFSYTLAFILFKFIKEHHNESINAKKTQLEHYKFKRNYTIFSKLLKSNLKIDTTLDNPLEMIFGNKNSNLEIVVVTNPFCSYCKPVHKTIKKILQRYNEDVKIIIRFNITISKKNAELIQISSRLIELYNTKGKEDCLQAMDQIYGEELVNNWFKKWGNCYDKEKFQTALKLEREWCVSNNINFTPEILIDGRSYPKEYNRSDILYFIEDLLEN